MKKIKIIILIIINVLLCACYDYHEITDLGIIVAVGIDYKDDEYIITYELLEDNQNKESANIKSYTVTGSGKTITKAFENTANKIIKKAYYTHTDILLISEEIAKNHMQKTMDFLLRSNDLRENFDVAITMNPKELLNSTSEYLPVIGSNIIKSISTDKYSNGISLEKKYSDVVTEMLSFGIDTTIPKVSIKNNTIILDGIAYFDEYEYIDSLTLDDSTIFNLLKHNTFKIILETNEFDDNFAIAIYRPKIKIEFNNNSIIISGIVQAEILENTANIDIKNKNNIKEIENDFSVLLNDKIINLIKKSQQSHSDFLGISSTIYKKNRIKNDLLWQYLDIESNVKVNISKKGIIYEVNNE